MYSILYFILDVKCYSHWHFPRFLSLSFYFYSTVQSSKPNHTHNLCSMLFNLYAKQRLKILKMVYACIHDTMFRKPVCACVHIPLNRAYSSFICFPPCFLARSLYYYVYECVCRKCGTSSTLKQCGET